MGEEVESAPTISYQNNYKTKDLNVDVYADKAKANKNMLAYVENQYLTSDPSVLKAFFANLVGLSVKNAFFLNLKG